MMVRKTAFLWLLAPLGFAGVAINSAAGQDVTSGSPVAVSYATDDPKTPPAPPSVPGSAAPAAPMAPAAPAAAGGSCTTCGTCESSCGCNTDCCKLDCPAQEVHRLFADNCWLKCHDITVQGFVEAGTTFRDSDRDDGFNGPDGFNDRYHEVQLNQAYTTIQKALKNNECCWDSGFTVDLLWGSDYRYPLSRGLDAHDNGTPRIYSDDRRFYGLAIPQAYLEFGTSKLSYKLGHFYTLLGNEVVPAIGNTFYSHSYMFLYAYPFTHTGVNATYKPNDQLTLVGGINDGWDNFDDVSENISVTGQAIFSAKDKHTTLTYAYQDGLEPIAPNVPVFHNRFVNSIILAHDWNDRMSYVIENGDGFQSDGAAGGGTATWYGIDTYLTYKMNCCWTAAARLEWFRDNNGTRVAPVGDFISNNTASAGGFAGNFYDVTMGLNYHPNGNVQIRPEVRYDWYTGNRNGAGNLPYFGGTSDHQWIPAIDAIVQF